MSEIPRRARIDQYTPTEQAIYKAIQSVENLPADERLTKAVILLGEAKEWVSDYIENVSIADHYPRPAPQSSEVLEEVKKENERLRAVVVDTDKLFNMIDEYFTGLPGLVPEEAKIQVLINKMQGKRMATKAVHSALSRHTKEKT